MRLQEEQEDIVLIFIKKNEFLIKYGGHLSAIGMDECVRVNDDEAVG